MFRRTAIRKQSTVTATKMALGILLSVASMVAQAVPITGLFTTGVDGLGNVLGGGAADTNYAILSPGQQAIVVNQVSIPGTWVVNNATSRWIWQSDNGLPVNVTLTFRTTFNLTGLDASTAQLTGTWSTDNYGDDILINGNSSVQTCIGFGSFCNFSIGSGFVAGINTLDFIVRDVGAISGFRVGSISGSANTLTTPVPEPVTLALLGLGLAGLGFSRRKAT